MSDDDFRRDYGPAGCAEGCATRGAQLLVILGALVALVRSASRKGRR